MSKERELLKEIMSHFAKGGITIRKFEDSSDVAETLHTAQELLAQPEPVTNGLTITSMAVMPNGVSVGMAVMSNGVPVGNVYDAYEEGRKSVMVAQEHVAWMNDSGGCFLSDGNKYSENWTALYAAPPKRIETEPELNQESRSKPFCELKSSEDSYSQEPVAWRKEHPGHGFSFRSYDNDGEALYTAPPKREPLSEDEIFNVWPPSKKVPCLSSFTAGVKFAEKAHGIRNER
jgi:hypothetical protein